jgi:hypothetical protein
VQPRLTFLANPAIQNSTGTPQGYDWPRMNWDSSKQLEIACQLERKDLARRRINLKLVHPSEVRTMGNAKQ